MDNNNNARLLTEVMLSERYSIGLRQLRLMRMRKEGPEYIKVSGQIGRSGGRVLYRIDAVESWLKNRPCGGERFETRPLAMVAASETR
jgi:hypothetical protein